MTDFSNDMIRDALDKDKLSEQSLMLSLVDRLEELTEKQIQPLTWISRQRRDEKMVDHISDNKWGKSPVNLQMAKRIRH